MLIGVKYCGGCNPRYDRVACLERLKQGRPDDRIVTARPGVYYDVLLVLCGCLSRCADLTGLSGARIVTVSAPEDCGRALAAQSTKEAAYGPM